VAAAGVEPGVSGLVPAAALQPQQLSKVVPWGWHHRLPPPSLLPYPPRALCTSVRLVSPGSRLLPAPTSRLAGGTPLHAVRRSVQQRHLQQSVCYDSVIWMACLL
jgi:hypothetical protein